MMQWKNARLRAIMICMDVKVIAKRANIPITREEERDLSEGFVKTLKVLDTLKNIDIKSVEPVSQVTGLENVTREDEIDVTRMFTQKQALANAKRSENGFFVVNKVLE